jgi:hypothetical protein
VEQVLSKEFLNENNVKMTPGLLVYCQKGADYLISAHNLPEPLEEGEESDASE